MLLCCPQASQTLPSTPPPPHLPFLLSLTLTQWAISVVGGFYLCSQAGCRHGEGCSAPKDYVLVRAYASERPHLRPAQPESLFPDPTQDLRPEKSQGINRQQPSSVAMPVFFFLWENRSCSAQALLQI